MHADWQNVLTMSSSKTVQRRTGRVLIRPALVTNSISEDSFRRLQLNSIER